MLIPIDLQRIIHLIGEQGNTKERSKSCKELEIDNRRSRENREKAGVNICDSSESSEIREYANIQEIKDMNNMLFYNRILKKLVEVNCEGKSDRICCINESIAIYETHKDGEDVFIHMGGCCIWLKQANMDTTAINMANIMGKVKMIGYVLNDATKHAPKIIKAVAIYV